MGYGYKAVTILKTVGTYSRAISTPGMPAPQSFIDPRQVRPVLGHVSVCFAFELRHSALILHFHRNLMVDTFLANTNIDEQVYLTRR